MSKHSFYRPHDRSATWYTGEVTDPITGEVTKPPSMTKQSFAAECDINNIIKQYKVTGMISHISARAAQGSYLDLPDPLDFQESLNVVAEAQRAFDTLPSKVRDRFDNNPTKFLEFMADPANGEELVKLGLASRVGDPAPAPAPDPAPAPAPAPSPPSP